MESDGGGGDEGGGVGGVEGMGGWIFLGMLQENMGKFPAHSSSTQEYTVNSRQMAAHW